MIFLFSTFWLGCLDLEDKPDIDDRPDEEQEEDQSQIQQQDLDSDGFSEMEGDCDDLNSDTNPDAS